MRAREFENLIFLSPKIETERNGRHTFRFEKEENDENSFLAILHKSK